MLSSSRIFTVLPALCAGVVVLSLSSASSSTGSRGRIPHPTETTILDPTPKSNYAEVILRSAMKLTRNEAEVQGEELAIDDGTSDGVGLLEDGLTLAVRLTPTTYPVKLTAIRIYFVKFKNSPDPAGQTVRLIAFNASSPKPPAGVSYLVDQRVVIPRTGAFVDFAIPNGPTITEGDLWVGYQAPYPANGVGFGADTSGPQADRTFWLDYGDMDWGGPLSFTDGTKANALIRARVTTTTPESGDFELRTDDGSVDAGLLRDGGIYVNRLTPPKYPAKLKSIRIFVPQMAEQPSPEGKTIRVIAFSEPKGSGTPPESPKLEVSQPLKLGKPGGFLDVAVDGPVLVSGDLYVGFEAPNPHAGVAFAVDTNGQPFQRMFRSRDGGKTFTGPVELMGESSQTIPVNLMVRAVVRLGEEKPEADFSLKTSASEVDLSEGGKESLECAVRGEESKEYSVRARFDPPAPGLTVTPAEQRISSEERVAFEIASSGPSETLSAPLILEASDGEATVRVTVPVYLWREVASAAIGAMGGRVDSPGVSAVFPKGAWEKERVIKIYTGKPVTRREDSLASPIFRLEGLPDNYSGGLEIRMPLSPVKSGSAASRSAEAGDGMVAVLQFALPSEEGKTVPVQSFQPAKREGDTVVLNLPPKKATVANRFSLWMLNGWYTLQSTEGNFLVFYPFGARDTAVVVAERLENALRVLESSDVGIPVLDRISGLSTLGNVGFTTHPIRATLDNTLESNGVTKRGQIFLDLKNMKDEPGRTKLRSTPGHELMHIAQNLYGEGQGTVDWWRGRPDPTVWADDALATWFEPHAIKEPSYVPDVMAASLRDFLLAGPLKIPGNYAGDRDYGYGAASFLTYVYRFLDKTVPSKWIVQRAPDREPWALLMPLIGGDSAMAKHWRNFGERLFRKELFAGANFPDPAYLMPLADSEKFEFMKSGEREDKKWSQAHDLSMKFYSFLLSKPAPKLTDSTVLGFQILQKYPDADLYVMGIKSGKLYGMQRGEGELTLDADSVAGELGLVVAIVNASYDPSPTIRSRRDITVRMGLADPQVKIKGGYLGGDRVIGHTYDFSTINRNIPDNATYSWDFGEKTAQGRTVKTSWSKAGTYKVRVEVRFGNETLKDEVTVVVAPDTPPAQKEDVLFEVYRRVKNAFGTSQQKCNDYSISISDPKGVVVDGGTSIARNGAWETRLPVANGYSYQIRYNYTTPCRDSGTASGKFDVKAGMINSVRVETPPCEQ
jgi:hypothetical protein